MADDDERAKAEKLAAAKKRVAQLQKQKKKANKKTTGDQKESESPRDTETPQGSATPEEPLEEKKDELETEGDKGDEEEHEPVNQEPFPLEPMPEAPTSPGPEAEPQPERLDATPRASHGRQPSLSIQSKMRSSSFRKTSLSHGSVSPSPSATLKSPSLPPLTGDDDEVHEVYRKQSTKIEELDKDKRRLEEELEEATGRWRKTEDQLEDLREASVDSAELRDQLQKAEGKSGEIEALKAEIASLQRQNSHLQTKSHRNNNASVSGPGPSESPPSDLVKQLESKSATIEAMELEISNLRAQVASQSTSSTAHESQIAALEEKLSKSESALEQSQREFSDTKHALNRASEKAVKEGVDKTSTETLIKSLQREIEELKHEKTEADKKIDTLEKKLQTLGNLHKESESRHQSRLREGEKTEQEAGALRKRLASIENENLRLKEEQENLRKRDSGGGGDDDAIDELEDEERSRLQRRVRDLEGEVFDLRRGVWREKRQELSGEDEGPSPEDTSSPAAANNFDDVDLVGGAPEHARRRSMAMAHQQQHSSFSTVLSSGFAAFTGANRSRAPSNQQQHPPATRGSLELLSEEDEFDEDAFARAQAEEEAKKRVEWVRGIKSKLKDWKGWRLDLVDSRAGAEGAGVGMGEIFEV
ncbi:M protein repeat protein [Aspergillus sp. HF37]|nr:M protein repeat protein [Aspergillus sp. HF37]